MRTDWTAQFTYSTQAISMVQAFLLAFSDAHRFCRRLASDSTQHNSGIVNAFDVPARQSFVVDMVEIRMTSATPLRWTLYVQWRKAGGAIHCKAFSFAYVGEGVCFLLNESVSFSSFWLSLLWKPLKRYVSKVLRTCCMNLKRVFDMRPVLLPSAT